jgi:hypothetical protein
MRTRHLALAVVAAAALSGCAGEDAGTIARISGVALSVTGNSPVVVTTSPVVEFPGSNSGVSGTATLTRTSNAISVSGSAIGLTNGYAYTIWFVIFDNPRGCNDDGCGEDDLFTRQAQVAVVNGGGFVAGAGAVNFSGLLPRHDPGDRQVVLGSASGIGNTYGAEVHVVLKSHGTAETDPANLAVQLSTVDGFCNIPVIGCEDVGAVVFAPTGSPGT